ncbi:MAG: hypothetical protein ABI634_07215 [Acidobacteriota bacterium]
MAHPIATLFVEELKATLRGHFAWLGAAAVLFAVGVLATVGTQDVWLDGYGIVAYGFAPLIFIPLGAGFIASPRATRFVESVFTAPVERSQWLLAKALVLSALAAAYYVALLPMFAVYAAHVPVPTLLRFLMLWAPGTLLISVSVGVLIGVLFIGRSVAAPVAAGTAALLVYAAAVPLQELLVSQGNGATRTGHLMLVSPLVLLKNALGFALVATMVPANTTSTWVAFFLVAVGALALAAWIFLRAQGVETWETSPRQRGTIAMCLTALALLPIVAADTNYDRPAPAANHAPPLRGVFGRAPGSMALVMPGAPFPQRCCSPVLNRDASALGTDEVTHRDLLLALPVDASIDVSDAAVQIAPEGGLEMRAETDAIGTPVVRLERHHYAIDQGPVGADGRRLVDGWVARICVSVRPTQPWDIGGDRYPLAVTASYRVPGDVNSRAFNARGAIDAQVSSAWYEMAIASGILPLMCLLAAVVRWRRTR